MSAKDELEKLYTDNLANQKEQIQQSYNDADKKLQAQKDENNRITQTNLNRTAVESQKDAMNFAELQNAYGLSSGARAQARIAQDNQMEADMTAIRNANAMANQGIEDRRADLANQLTIAINKAVKENDMAKAQALYNLARQEEAKLNAQKEKQAALLAQIGDFSIYGDTIGLTQDQIDKLNSAWATAHAPRYSGGGGGGDSSDGDWSVGEKAEESSGGSDVDMDSILNLGYGAISPEALAEKVQSGDVIATEENGKLSFKPKPDKWYSEGLPGNWAGGGLPSTRPKRWEGNTRREAK